MNEKSTEIERDGIEAALVGKPITRVEVCVTNPSDPDDGYIVLDVAGVRLYADSPTAYDTTVVPEEPNEPSDPASGVGLTEREILWGVQTLAANLDREQLLRLYRQLRATLGEEFASEIINEWKHELDEEED